MTVFANIARAAWGEAAPAWVIALAEACDKGTQSDVAAQLKYSAGVVSAVLRRSYKGDMRSVEQAVRGVLFQSEVDCPALVMAIPTQECVEHQRARFSTASPQSVRLFRTCPSCLHRSHGESDE